MTTTDSVFNTLKAGISVYESNCTIDDNLINAVTPYPICVGISDIHIINVIICHNTIRHYGRTYQGAINLLETCSNIVISNNEFWVEGSDDYGVSIRAATDDLLITNNQMDGGAGMINFLDSRQGVYRNIKINGNNVNTTLFFAVTNIPNAIVEDIVFSNNYVTLSKGNYQKDAILVKSNEQKLRSVFQVNGNIESNGIKFNGK